LTMIILLLNLIIAILGTTHDEIKQNATEEYRWAKTRYLSQTKYALWPIPFNLIQALLAGCAVGYYLITDSDVESKPQKFSPGLRINHHTLFSNIISSFFKNELGDKYEEYMLNDEFNEGKAENQEELLFLDYGDEDESSKLTADQKETSKKLSNGIVGQINLPWILHEIYKENIGASAVTSAREHQPEKFQIGKRTERENAINKVDESELEIRLTFELGRISGQGNDNNGPYYWDGTYKFEKETAEHVIWKFNLRKKYFSRHTITYTANYKSSNGKPIIFEGKADDGLHKWSFSLKLKNVDHSTIEVE